MRAKMTIEEFKGQLSRFGITETEAINLIWLKTRAVISQAAFQTHISRYGSLSPAYTATFRLLFRELERDHERV